MTTADTLTLVFGGFGLASTVGFVLLWVGGLKNRIEQLEKRLDDHASLQTVVVRLEERVTQLNRTLAHQPAMIGAIVAETIKAALQVAHRRAAAG